jgi:predicted membrane protein
VGNKRPIVTPGLIFGLAITTVGTILYLWNLGIIDAWRWWRYWPAALVLFGVAQLLQSQGSKVWGALLTVAGTVLLLETLGYIRPRLWENLWPLGMIAAGLALIWQALRGRREAADADAISYLNHWAVFGGFGVRSNSQDFRGGQILAVFGGGDVDLRKATLGADDVVLYANCVFGGHEIRVPEDWNVISKGVAVFGGYEDSTDHRKLEEGAPAKRFIVKGFAVFGGVEIKN